MPPTGKKKPKKKRSTLRPALVKTVLLTLLVTLTGAAVFYILFVGPPPDRGRKTAPVPTLAPTPSKQRPAPAPEPKTPPQAALPAPADQPPPPAAAVAAPPAGNHPRLAIIIDDMGYHRQVGQALIAMPVRLSFAFLPHAPFAGELLRAARAKGSDILLHLPLEPKDRSWDPGAGALQVAMPAATMAKIFADDLAAVPGAIGVNNHMGSRFTEDRRAMTTLVQLLADNRLFFLDSSTTANSVGYDVARAAGLAAGRRDVFLDNDLNPAAIARQLGEAVRIARQHGGAIAIGHPKQPTLDSLRRFIADPPADVEIVAVHQLIRQP
ncbi:MAG: divergent polysaccharide deacetylase family protein [Thermodesulfobacteriota bacterium]